MSDLTPLPSQRAPQVGEPVVWLARDDITRLHAYEDAIRGVALAVVRARAATDSMGRLPDRPAVDLLLACEQQLSALIALGYVPDKPGPRRRLT